MKMSQMKLNFQCSRLNNLLGLFFSLLLKKKKLKSQNPYDRMFKYRVNSNVIRPSETEKQINAEVTILIQKGIHLQHLESMAQNHWHYF